MDVLNNTMRDSLTNALTIIKSRDDAAGTNNLVATITDNDDRCRRHRQLRVGRG